MLTEVISVIITAIMAYLLGTGNLQVDILSVIFLFVAFGADYFLASRVGSSGDK